MATKSKRTPERPKNHHKQGRKSKPASKSSPDDDVFCGICFTKKVPKSPTCYISYCDGCLEQWVISQSQEHFSMENPLKCPSPSCSHLLTEDELVQKMSKKGYKKLNENRLRTYLSETDDIIRCPNPSCKYAGFLSTFHCGKPIVCKECNYSWTDSRQSTSYLKNGLRSSVFSKMLFLDERTEVWKILRTKPCPKCRVPILKDGGCPDMVCQRCMCNFCWTCCHLQSGHDWQHCQFQSFVVDVSYIMMLALTLIKLVFGITVVYNNAHSVIWWTGCVLLSAVQIFLRLLVTISINYNFFNAKHYGWGAFTASFLGSIAYFGYLYMLSWFGGFFVTANELCSYGYYLAVTIFFGFTWNDHGLCDEKTRSVALALGQNVLLWLYSTGTLTIPWNYIPDLTNYLWVG